MIDPEKIYSKRRIFIGLSMLMASIGIYAQTDVNFKGTLVNAPCMLAPGDELVSVDFSQIFNRSIYKETRTASQKFVIRLSDCDVSVMKSVKVTVEGDENLTLPPGFLKLDASSLAKGVAIGLENDQGQFFPLNSQTDKITLHNGDVDIKFQAFVQGEPDALLNQQIEAGSFLATATFSLSYQ